MTARTLALVLVISAVAPGCVPYPRPRQVTPSEQASGPQVERLGRWTGTEFVEVTPGSIPPSHLRVIVHGWAPGWQRAMDERPAPAWSMRDDEGQPFEPWMTELARAISARDPHSVVVVYSWLDDAATTRFPLAQRRAASRMRYHGQLLAQALAAAVSEDFAERSGQVHLLGHSYGARVATEAALAMAVPPIQLTLFDAPDAPVVRATGSQMELETLLPRLRIGWGAGETYVESYTSMVGRHYAGPGLEGVVDVSLSPPYSPFAYGPRHLYPMRFYAMAANESFGLGWSPLTPGAQAPQAGCYSQPFGRIELVPLCSVL